jgi:hypothetical protein
MAAFPTRGREQFAAHSAKIRADDTNILRTIVADGYSSSHADAPLIPTW